MGRAAGDLAAMFLANSAVEQEMLASIDQRPSIEEVQFIEELRSRSSSQKVTVMAGSDRISEAEFVLICLRRTKSVDTALIEYIYDKYKVEDQIPGSKAVPHQHEIQKTTGNDDAEDSLTGGPTIVGAMEITDGHHSYRDVPSSQL